jgi:hypothetical protein
MRIYFLVAVLGLIVVEAFLLPRTVRDFRTMQQMRSETASKAGLPVVLGPFNGYDADGRPLTLVTDDTRWIVPIVIHSSRMSSDLDYLGQLRKALPDRAITLVGVCDQGRCGQAALEFPLLAYGSYAPLRDIVRLDDQNQVLLLNQYWRVTKALRRDLSSPELAARILEVIGR